MNDQSLLAPKPKPAAPLACSWSLPVIVTPKLQALVYDILPWRKMPESDARSVGMAMKVSGTDGEAGPSLQGVFATVACHSSPLH